ncbi:T9SS type B sorting domain-containing protein [Flavobacterium sp. CYK-4]|uniref:T9SS type B sorting domain-containing protein n=1 Tax=Flavobacterium lotistagni TaxID=2709660 RepID=UPI00140C9855|nr:T9SS type B sorting domain-containing protein [Flavobacterium lotistagni]NHM06236.1 T9SS type B sorting domain-containing protein [Flavobacterium lotistagni]
MKKLNLLFFLLFTWGCFAQFSKIHYIPPLSGTNDASGSAQEQYLYISTPNVNPVNFRIIQLGGATITATVSKSAPYVFDCGFGTNTQLMVQKTDVNTILSNKGYIIDSDDLVYVSARVIAGNGNQSGAVISKGLAALGKQFRIGALLNDDPTLSFGLRHYTFLSVLATENNTLVEFQDLKPGIVLINNATAGNTPSSIILNSGQSFIMAVEGPASPFDPDQLPANRDGLIGSLVKANKPIAVNCGSFAGTNADNNLDLGFDQIVDVDKTGKNFIFIKSTGQDPVEKVLLIAHTNNTEIRLNNSAGTGPYDFLLNAGEHLVLDGSRFNAQGNLYVNTTENVFAYQTIGDNSRVDFANQELFFVPPLSCETPRIIDNIPLINKIGSRTYSIGRVTMITESGSTVNFQIDGTSYSISALSSIPGVVVTGPTVVGTTLQNYDTYVITGLSGNVSAYSTGELYLAAYATDGAATFGGFYSGFIFKPEITFNLLNTSANNCIPNAELRVNSLSSFDVFQWYFNGNPISGATQNFYNPTQPGKYMVKAAISNCTNQNISSDEIPISSCPIDTDNDSVNDNVDIDFDNDGITNCTESVGNQPIDLSNTATISVITSGNNPPLPVPFSGANTGNFITRTPIGKNNAVQFRKTFSGPTNIAVEYVNTGLASDLPDTNAQFEISSDINKTITVLNPNDQLLIDTNYDGIYESGITSYSSYEIHFRMNSAVVVTPGSGTFRFKSAATNTLTFKHTNLSDAADNFATFRLIETCVGRDSDLDGVADAIDIDSDNDGIPDNMETIANTTIAPSGIDANQDGMDDAYGTGITSDTDGDSVPNYLDLDSDNDGIYDLVEAQSGSPDTNLDGRIDGTPANFGSNGFFNTLETAVNSGVLNYTVADTDSNGIRNYLSLESDGDGCNDVIEAGFSDPNGDGLLGNSPLVTNTKGMVTSGTGYTLPNSNYNTGAPISIITQPSVAAFCTLQNSQIVIQTSPVDSYQWQVLAGTTWINVVDNANYSQSNTNALQLIAVPYSFNGNKYRVILRRNGNTCSVISDEVTLSLYALPVVAPVSTLVQCDDNNDGFTRVNLKEVEGAIANLVNRTFSYYRSLSAATVGNESSPDFINNPLGYFTNSTTVWVRVLDLIHGCFSVAELNVVVSTTQVPPTFNRKFYRCDDFLDPYGNSNANNNNRDGIASFDFSSVTNDIIAILPAGGNYRIKYYKNYQDAAMEIDALGNNLEISQNPADAESIFRYRNREYPSEQQIWVRIESIADNACYGLGPFVNLYVEPLPVAHRYNDNNLIRKCDDNQDGIFGFDTSVIETVVLNGQTNVTVSYFDLAGNPLPSPLPNPFVVNTSTTIRVRVTNNATLDPNGTCYDEINLQFVVDKKPQAFPVNSSLFSVCDDEADPNTQDSLYGFDTASIQSQILGGQTDMIVKYYNGSGQPLQSPLPNPFLTPSQNVTAVVENPINRTCPASINIPFLVKPTPRIALLGRDLICSTDPSFYTAINAALQDGSSISNYSYQWYLNGQLIPGATQYTLNVNVAGTYMVDVTTSLGCMKTRIIDVVASDLAHIDQIIINDLSDSNTVEIIASGSGILVYSLDDADDFQASNIFSDVPMGIHQVYVKDINGCGVVGPVEIYVLGIPKFFSPNGDDINDTWNLKGTSENYNKNARIRIFDRNGKFVKEIFGIDTGWDGTYQGRQLPADDYWYVIELEDARVLRGHFSLIR